jgi:hypothetical protein
MTAPPNIICTRARLNIAVRSSQTHDDGVTLARGTFASRKSFALVKDYPLPITDGDRELIYH